MAEHSTLSGASLHENKGVSTAAADTVATANGGSTVWKKLTSANLSTEVNSFANSVLHVRDEKTSGSNGGNSSAATYQTRTLQTTKRNDISASLASNRITLPAGTYYIEAVAPAYNVGGHRIRLQNITDGSTVVAGLNAYALSAQTLAFLRYQFTIASQKQFEIQHYTAGAVSTSGLGIAGSTGDTEVYTEVVIWKNA